MEFALVVKLVVLMAQSGTLPHLPALLAAWGIDLTPAQLEALQRLLVLLSHEDGVAACLQCVEQGPYGWIPGP